MCPLKVRTSKEGEGPGVSVAKRLEKGWSFKVPLGQNLVLTYLQFKERRRKERREKRSVQRTLR